MFKHIPNLKIFIYKFGGVPMKEHKKKQEESVQHNEHKKSEIKLKIKKKTLKRGLAVIGIIVIVVLAIVAIRNFAPSTGGGKVKLDFYVMSKCPYGIQVENGIAPVLEKMGDNINFNLNFIERENPDGSFTSLHGQTEVDGDIVQLCAIKYEPKKYMDMIVCMNKESGSIPQNWENCSKDNGLDVEKIRNCYEGNEGKQLLSESIKKTNAIGATGSPTIYVNNVSYNGGRDAASFQRGICNYIQEHPECKNIPACGSDVDCPAKEGKIPKCENPNTAEAKCTYLEPVKVEFIVLNDKNCASCDTSRIVSVSKQLFPGVQQRDVDISSAEGKALINEMGIVYVPAYIFDEKLTETNTWETNTNIKGSFEKIGNRWKILDRATGATHYVSEELRQQKLSAMGIKLGDNLPQIDFFVMSYCPYGNTAEEAIEPVYQLLKEKAEFNPHYVIYSNYQGGGADYCMDNGNYCSMHGIQELNQGIREICVDKYLGASKYFEFVLEMNQKCNSGNADSCWEGVAKDLGLDTEKIKQCERDEGLEIVKEEKRLNDVFGVSGSPTVFIDGEQYGDQRTPDSYKSALCAAFEQKPSVCSTVIESGNTTQQQPQGQC